MKSASNHSLQPWPSTRIQSGHRLRRDRLDEGCFAMHPMSRAARLLPSRPALLCSRAVHSTCISRQIGHNGWRQKGGRLGAPIRSVRSRPHVHLATGMILRAFAAHPVYQQHPEETPDTRCRDGPRPVFDCG
jgi:hypothetical protein